MSADKRCVPIHIILQKTLIVLSERMCVKCIHTGKDVKMQYAICTNSPKIEVDTVDTSHPQSTPY